MYKWWRVFLMLLITNGVSAEKSLSLSADEIDAKLIDLELQRTGNVKNYKSLLSEINTYKLQFNDYQRCFYNYLEQYNYALLNGLSQSLTGFQQLFHACDDPRIKIRIKNLEANIYRDMKKYKASIEALDYSLTHVSDVDDKHLLTIVYSAAFIVYSYLEQYPLSLQFSELLMDESDNPSDQCKGKYNRAAIYLKQGNVQINEAEIIQVFDYCYSVKEPIFAYLLKLEWYSQLIKSDRKGVKALDFSDIDGDLNMTASFGVASSLTSGYQWQTLISHADEALYQAKERGRNRVYRFDLAHTE